MDRNVSYALDAAKAITISRVSNSTAAINKQGGECVADFYEAIFNKILEIAQNADKD